MFARAKIFPAMARDKLLVKASNRLFTRQCGGGGGWGGGGVGVGGGGGCCLPPPLTLGKDMHSFSAHRGC